MELRSSAITGGTCACAAIMADGTALGPMRRLDDLDSLPDDVTVHLDAGYDSDKTRTLLSEHGLHDRIAHKGETAPIQASQRWHIERTHAWQNAFHRLARSYERHATIVDAFFDLADTVITVRSLIRGHGRPTAGTNTPTASHDAPLSAPLLGTRVGEFSFRVANSSTAWTHTGEVSPSRSNTAAIG